MDYIKSKLKFSTNTKEQLLSYGSISIEFVKIIVGSLLVVFVPQSCPDIDPITGNQLLTSHSCSITENFVDLISFNYFVLVWNFITLALFSANMIQEIHRERFIILNFDYNKEKPMKAIYPIFEANKKLEIYYMRNTIQLYYNNIICVVCVVLNILFSSIVLFYYYYGGFKTITTMLTNIILLLQKTYKNYNTLSYAKEKKVVLSTMLLSPYYYNKLDIVKYPSVESSSDISIHFNEENNRNDVIEIEV
jgi:hypothetical protein